MVVSSTFEKLAWQVQGVRCLRAGSKVNMAASNAALAWCGWGRLIMQMGTAECMRLTPLISGDCPSHRNICIPAHCKATTHQLLYKSSYQRHTNIHQCLPGHLSNSMSGNGTYVDCSPLVERRDFDSYIAAVLNVTAGNLHQLIECRAEVCIALWGQGNPDVSGIGVRALTH